MTRGLPSRIVVWGGLPPDVLATVAAAARARDVPISVYDQIYGGDPERRDPSPLRSIDDLRDAGAHPTVDNLRALAGLPPTNRDTLAALLACDPFAAGLPGHYPLRVGECDHCGFVTVLHDVTEYPHGDRRRLASCVGYHCAACCDAHPCDERGRGEAAFDFANANPIRRRLSTKLFYPPSIVLRAREHCLACRAVAAGVVPAISVVEHPRQRHTYQIVFFCGEDHGCPSCCCVEAAHNPKTTFRGDRDDILARAHVPAGAVRTLGPCSRCDCAGGTYDLGDVGPIRGQPLP